MMQQSTAKSVVIGTGSIGRRHAQNLAQLGAEVQALSWRELGLDGVLEVLETTHPTCAVIATATDMRLPLVAACAERNIALYIEKPLAFRPSEVAAVFQAAAPVAARSFVGFMMRYHPILQAMARENLGAAYRFQFEIGHDVTQWRQNWHFSQSYAARAQGGGVLLDLCHELDMAHCLLPGLALGAVDVLGHADFPGVDMAALCQLLSTHGMGSVAMDYLAPASTRRASLRGLAGCMDADFVASTLTIDRGQGTQTQHFTFDRNDMFLAAMRDFLALAEGRAPVSGTANVPVLTASRAVCDLIAQAWARRAFGANIAKGLT